MTVAQCKLSLQSSTRELASYSCVSHQRIHVASIVLAHAPDPAGSVIAGIMVLFIAGPSTPCG